MFFVFPNNDGEYVRLGPLLMEETHEELLPSLDGGAIRLPGSTEDEQIEPLSFLGFIRVVNQFDAGPHSNLFVWGSDECSWVFRRAKSELIRVFHPDPEAVRSQPLCDYLRGIGILRRR